MSTMAKDRGTVAAIMRDILTSGRPTTMSRIVYDALLGELEVMGENFDADAAQAYLTNLIATAMAFKDEIARKT